MTFELFFILLTILSIVTPFVTNAVKKFLDSLNVKYASNIVVLIVSIIVGSGGTIVFYLWNHFEFTTLNIICIFLMIAANWLGSMLGYDKVMQAIKQIRTRNN